MNTLVRRAFVYAAGVLVSITLLCSLSSASPVSIGVNGINAAATGLNGSTIGLGQVEVNRPGLTGYDTAANSNANVTPAGIFEQNFNATPNRGPGNHASQVASVIISKGAATAGVAPAASLYSGDDSGPDMISSAVTADRIAQIDGVRAINHSFGIGGALNTQSLYTSFIDWSASRYDVLHVIAGNETGPSRNSNIPTDSYNGIVVSYTAQMGNAIFDDIDPGNRFDRLPTDNRRTVDITAPGANIQMEGLNNVAGPSSGTSFAAPHVTGATGLLQQFTRNRRLAGDARFDADSQRHEVMKAVMMNSADKRTGVLGMTKTILRTDGDDWITQRAQEVAGTDGPAIDRNFIPLDLQMGTGQLNVGRSVTQLTPGEFDPGAVPRLAWDYQPIGTAAGSLNRYQLPTLGKDSWISITLAWDRRVTLTENIAGFANTNFDGETFVDLNGGGFNAGEPLFDMNGNGTYNAGVAESFTGHSLTDLDLFLVPRGDDFTSALPNGALSISGNTTQYSVEHIFTQVKATQQWDILVRSFAGSATPQNYAIAWWSVPEPSSAALGALCALALIRRRRS